MERTELDQTTLDLLDFNELKLQLEETIKALPEKCQIIFRMKYEQGLSQKQIAEELDISEKTIEAHLSKARKTIRNSFGNLSSIIFLLYL
ncbi:RNA polymerase sigma factor [compost metagenome]